MATTAMWSRAAGIAATGAHWSSAMSYASTVFVAWKLARSPPTTYTFPPMRAAPTSWRAVARDARLTH